MSALTDLFTALATKIRSKTGGSDTYTPPQMVNAIDDVYDAGVAAGTPTLDGDATTGNVLSGKTFYSNSTTKQTGAMTNNGNFQGDIDPSSSLYVLDPGYYSDISLDVLPHTEYSPSSSTHTLLAMGESKTIDLGAYHKKRYVNVEADEPAGIKSITANGSNIDVRDYAKANVSVSGTAITPSNSSPASMTSGTLYTPSASGYAISSYDSVSPSSSGTYFSSGMKKMASSGYAYSSQPAINYPFAFAVISATGSIEIQGNTENRAAVACITDTNGRCRLGSGSASTIDGTYASIQITTAKNTTTRTRKITIKIAGRYLMRTIVTSGSATETVVTYTAGQEITATDGVWFYIGA